MGRSHDTVSFLTDYGLDDEFVGVVKSVIRDMAPHVTVVDLTHGIRPFDVRGGVAGPGPGDPLRRRGHRARRRRPRRRHVAPGAGDRGRRRGRRAHRPGQRPARAGGRVVGGAERAVELTNPEHHLAAAGATFAGRDVFAPVAAHLCNGVDLAELGPLVDPAALMPGMLPLPREEPDGFHTEVLWVDRFGNCQLNVGPEDLTPGVDVWAVTIGDERRAAKLATSYGELAAGSVGLVLDSHGMYSLALDQRSAAHELRLATGDAVVLSVFDGRQRSPRRGHVARLAAPRPVASDSDASRRPPSRSACCCSRSSWPE